MLIALLVTFVLSQAPQPSVRPGFDVAPGDSRIWQRQESMRARQDAERQIAAAPDTVAAYRALLQLDRVDEALDVLMRLVQTRPTEVADALTALQAGRQFSDGTRDYSPKLRAIFTAAHERAAQLPREDAAALEQSLVGAEGVLAGGSAPWRNRAIAFVANYRGTRAAAMTDISLATFGTTAQVLSALDEIVRAHPRSDVGGAALYQKGFQLAYNAYVTGPDRQPDPTDRFMRVLAIVDELESGVYPTGEWVDKAPGLIVGFNSYKPEYTAEHLDAMIAAYRGFIRRHFSLDPLNPFGNGLGYVVTSKLAELYKLKGDADGVDRTMRELENDSPDPQGVAYAHAVWMPAGQKRMDMLEAIAGNARNAYAAKALATLALDDLAQGNAASARGRYRSFLQRYPHSQAAWIAALHAAEADAALDGWAAAERGFVAAAETYADTPMAVVLGRLLAAHATEATGQPARAAGHYARALDAWDRETWEVSLYTMRTSPVFRREEITRRADTLRAVLAQPGGDIVERGRWQLGNGDRAGAIASFEMAIESFPSSPVLPRARLLLHRARTEAALDLANIERADADPKAAAAQLDAIGREPPDAAVIAARIARASMRWSGGDADGARTAISAALGDWITNQPHSEPRTDLERDAAAIRDAVFRPLGDGIFAGERGWNAFTWPDTAPAFLLIDPDINVKLPSGDVVTLTVTKPLPDFANVVFADETMQALLTRTMIALGGTKRRQPTGVMETPNQPAGESINILSLWNAFFPTRAGHWGGWEFTSYPRLTRLEFLDAARTRAAASVTIGYSGVTVVLEKRDGAWVPVRLTNPWIT